MPDTERAVWVIKRPVYEGWEIIAACTDEGTAETIREKLRRVDDEYPGYFRMLVTQKIPFMASPEDLIIRTAYHVLLDEHGNELMRFMEPEIIFGPSEPETRVVAPWSTRYPVAGISILGYDAALKAAKDYLARVGREKGEGGAE